MKIWRALFLAAPLFLALQGAEAAAQCRSRGTTHEQILRTRAVKKNMPVFPAEAARAGTQGVAVARVEVDEAGRVMSVEVLQASHPLIKKALTEALMQWRFRPFQVEGEPTCVRGKLTFYFRLDDRGRGYVANPKVYS